LLTQSGSKEDERKQRRRASNRRAAERYRQKQKASVDDFKSVRTFMLVVMLSSTRTRTKTKKNRISSEKNYKTKEKLRGRIKVKKILKNEMQTMRIVERK